MKDKKALPEPTKAEMEILQVLWQHGPNTVRFVNDCLNEQRKVQYTSTLKQMQLMAEKKMLLRDESAMKHIYKAALDEAATKAQMLNRFVDAIYQGSAGSLMMQLLGNHETTPEELAAIKKMLNGLEKN
jgi:BlaI family transcriptional regulator, penicillinase repressor